MTILDRLNSGELHAAARRRRPDCVDATGNVHATPQRAAFVNWLIANPTPDDDPRNWPADYRAAYHANYAPRR